MPNHITNVITAEPHVLACITALFKSDKEEGRAVDFNKLIQMPDFDQGDIPVESLRSTPNWYQWSCSHWGTKWNAYDMVVDTDGIRFETAWSCPEPIVRKLAEMLPGVEWQWAYADEDIGSNCGLWVRTAAGLGQIEPENPDEFACSITGRDYDELLADREEFDA
jgi:hypothetical protein